MALNNELKKRFKAIGHQLKPVVTIGENGLSEGVLGELDRALNDHELIKIKLAVTEREDRRALIDELCASSKAELVQVIGKMALIYRKAREQNRNLSNVVRYTV